MIFYSRLRDVLCNIRVVSVYVYAGFWDMFGEEIVRPERAVLVSPSLVGMICLVPWVQAVDETETGEEVIKLVSQ